MVIEEPPLVLSAPLPAPPPMTIAWVSSES